MRNEEELTCLCCKCGEMVLPSGSRGFGLNSHFHFFTSESHDFFFLFVWVFLLVFCGFFEISGNFHIALIEAKISLPMQKAYIRICYVNTWGFPSLWEAELATKPFSISSLEGQCGLPCAGHMAEPGVSLNAVKGWWYMELIPCPHSSCPLFLSDLVQTSRFHFRGPTWKTGSDKKKVTKE